MRYLNHVVRTKGFIHSFERSAQILKRFCMGRKKFLQMISFLKQDLNGGAKITFCVTASLLWGNAVLFRKLLEMGHDVAAHGYIHTNMKNKSRKEQIDIIRKCSHVFSQFQMPVSGFRCPYLSYNNDTLEVLQRGGFAWTSNNMILWPNGLSGGNGREVKTLSKINNLYHIDSAESRPALPRFRDRCLDIPITGPDDEMLLDRFRVKKKAKIAEIWMNVLKKTHERGEMFHLLFHPERFPQIREGIKEIMDGLKKFDQPAWVASLMEITQWWRQRQTLSFEHEPTGDSRVMTWIKVPERGVMLVKAQGTQAPPAKGAFFGSYVQARPAGRRNGRQAFLDAGQRKGTIGLSARCPAEMEMFLREEGFLVETSTRPEEHAVFLDGPRAFSRKDEAAVLGEIENSPFPVLRLWRWPDGKRSSFTISVDVDSVTLMDFVRRALKF
jgi:peptidoglycan/xylan/chitin deacetylase (PgdA/CDA1 family)